MAEFDRYLVGLTINYTTLTDVEIREIEDNTNFILPNDYKKFLKVVSGCEGIFGGKNYAIFWKGEDLARYNREYEVEKYLEGMLLFGSDGGGEAFAFDSLNEMGVVRVPFVGMERDLAVPLAKTFTELLKLLCETNLYE